MDSTEDRKGRFRLLAYVGLAIAGALGLWRVETVADEAHTTAVNFEAAEEREEREEGEERERDCITRNYFQQNTRQKFASLFDTLEAILIANETDPQEIAEDKAIVDQLRNAVPNDPETEDRDCNGDGRLTDADYDINREDFGHGS